MTLPKDKRNRLLTVAMATLIGALALWQGLIQTRKSGLAQCQARLLRAKDKVSQAQNWVSRLDQLQTEMDATLADLAEIEEQMAPAGDPYSWSLLLLDKARAGHQVEVLDVTRPVIEPVKVLPQFPYNAAMFTVRGFAHYHEFGKFLADFENKYPYFRVQNILLETAAAASTDPAAAQRRKEQLSFRMDIVALIKPSS